MTGEVCDGDAIVIDREEAHRYLDTLDMVARHLTAVDESNAAANMADVRHRPLTRHVVEQLADLDLRVHPRDDTPSS